MFGMKYVLNGSIVKSLAQELSKIYSNKDANAEEPIICGNDPRIVLIFYKPHKVRIIIDTPHGTGGDPPRIIDLDVDEFSYKNGKVIIPQAYKATFENMLKDNGLTMRAIDSSIRFEKKIF
jgi:hypothetical protein